MLDKGRASLSCRRQNRFGLLSVAVDLSGARRVIVGAYVGQARNTHGFVFRKGPFATVDAPNALQTFSNAINDKGQIVGGYQSNDLKFRGYVLRGDEFTVIDRPEATLVNAIGINNEGSERISVSIPSIIRRRPRPWRSGSIPAAILSGTTWDATGPNARIRRQQNR